MTQLELGSVPLPVLESRIDRFIAGGGKGPYRVAVIRSSGFGDEYSTVLGRLDARER